MREYGKVAIRMWSDRRVLKLDQTAKLVFLYLLTGPESNCIGCFRCSAYHLAAASVCSPDDGEVALCELERVGLILWDRVAGLVLLPNFLKYNPLTSPAVAKGAESEIMRLPDSPLLSVVIESLASQTKMSDGWRDRLSAIRSCDESVDESPDESIDKSLAPHPHPHPHPQPQPKKRGCRSAAPTDRSADSVNRDKMAEWDGWLSGFDERAVKLDVPVGFVPYAFAEALRCVDGHYAERGGRLTPTRLVKLADALDKFDPVEVCFAVELYCDCHGSAKDERYLVGIARRLSRLSDAEFNADMRRHRDRFKGRGLYAGRPK